MFVLIRRMRVTVEALSDFFPTLSKPHALSDFQESSIYTLGYGTSRSDILDKRKRRSGHTLGMDS